MDQNGSFADFCIFVNASIRKMPSMNIEKTLEFCPKGVGGKLHDCTNKKSIMGNSSQSYSEESNLPQEIQYLCTEINLTT